ncbi:xanthine dehydrogenase accessory protein XdhC [Halomonas vilamensis]|uniref:Xanthine dehydrogenase accessory protein XdhC n=1 Tax=Vreelandella vilamensis TaxID=531309 RepID=A0ABU1H4K9_9GAMM|nr:xanthine dehydrogenase accessory protein XdhC [Halomonas vilamensis]MDR5899235.1 xanthine dehydrogenase accessory protein XdhC [Halomonas vilamensis]
MNAADTWHAALHRLQREGLPHVLATQVTSAGSTPREPGARMVITEDTVFDTLGGGTFEWQTIAAAREKLAAGETGMSLEAFSLGGRSGQCCGGFVNVLIEVFPGSLTTLALFGAGHVGREIVPLAAPLGWRMLWFDSRKAAFPGWAAEQPRLSCHHTDDPDAAPLPAGVHALVMTHDHGEDRALLHALLARGDCASIGLIGSQSKWASFRGWLHRAGHDEATLSKVRCPIGMASGPNGEKTTGGDKTPYAIALAAVAELLPCVARPERGEQRGLSADALRPLFSPSYISTPSVSTPSVNADET